MPPDRHDGETPRNRAGRAIDDHETDSDAEQHSPATDRAATARDRSTATDESSTTRSPGSREKEGADGADANEADANEADADQTSPDVKDADAEFGPVEDAGPRDIVVPSRLFKLITVVTTLLAVPAIVLGFMFLDAATLRTSVARWTILVLVDWLGLPIGESAISILLGVVGILLIGAGAGIYIVGSRFRAAGMGNAEEDTDEDSTNG